MKSKTISIRVSDATAELIDHLVHEGFAKNKTEAICESVRMAAELRLDARASGAQRGEERNIGITEWYNKFRG